MKVNSASVRSVIGRILDVIADARAATIDVSLRAGKLTLSADLGTSARAASAAYDGPTTVTEAAVLAVLEKRRAGYNLANLARHLRIAKKTSVKGLLESLIRSGQVERAAGKYRLPGRTQRGRPGRKPAQVRPADPPVTPVATKPAAPPPKPAVKKPITLVKAAKPFVKPVPAKKRVRNRAKKKAATVTASTTPVANQPPADVPPVVDENVAATAEDPA